MNGPLLHFLTDGYSVPVIKDYIQTIKKREGRTQIKFIYSEKATKFCDIFTLLLSYVVSVKSKVKILQNFVAFSEYMNFTDVCVFTINHQRIYPLHTNVLS